MATLSKIRGVMARDGLQFKWGFIQDAVLSIFARFGSVIGSYLSLSLISRSLSIEHFGLFSLVLSIQMFLTTTIEFGVSPTLVRYAAYYSGANEVERTYSLYKLGLLLKIVLS